jgi:hypothetical protein
LQDAPTCIEPPPLAVDLRKRSGTMRQDAYPTITTTLYDVISALHTLVGVEDDQVITAMVTYLLRTGQIRRIEISPTDPGWIRYHEHRHLNDAFACPLA